MASRLARVYKGYRGKDTGYIMSLCKIWVTWGKNCGPHLGTGVKHR